mmetsp:Transcript_33787/g.111761  ORF Transcript_33787/g.111761 Transcript_33787/m.111761 type:complete len:269 (-) Transcript_33787:74-880(-)
MLARPHHHPEHIAGASLSIDRAAPRPARLEGAVVPLLCEHRVQQRGGGELPPQLELAREPQRRGELLALNQPPHESARVEFRLERPAAHMLAREAQARPRLGAAPPEELLDPRDTRVDRRGLRVLPLAPQQRRRRGDDNHLRDGVEGAQPQLLVLRGVENHPHVVRAGGEDALLLGRVRRPGRHLPLQRPDVPVPKVDVKHPPPDLKLVPAHRRRRLNLGVQRDERRGGGHRRRARRTDHRRHRHGRAAGRAVGREPRLLLRALLRPD